MCSSVTRIGRFRFNRLASKATGLNVAAGIDAITSVTSAEPPRRGAMRSEIGEARRPGSTAAMAIGKFVRTPIRLAIEAVERLRTPRKPLESEWLPQTVT